MKLTFFLCRDRSIKTKLSFQKAYIDLNLTADLKGKIYSSLPACLFEGPLLSESSFLLLREFDLSLQNFGVQLHLHS